MEDQKKSDDPDTSNIDFGECENILKKEYNIPKDESLIVFKTDIIKDDFSSKYVLYEVYHPLTLEQLDLNKCNDVQISISVPVILDNNVESLVNSLSESGYNIFNENDSFYNDICATYTSKNRTDMLLLDRKKDIYTVSQNQSLCQSGCEIQSYNSTTKKAKCDCSISSENITGLNVDDLFNKKEIVQNFYDTLTNSNFHVLKCYQLIINFSNIIKNIGEIFMTLLFITFIILVVIYCIKGKKTIHNHINSILRFRNMNKKNNNHNKNEKEKINDKKKTKIKIKDNKDSTIRRKINKSGPPKKLKIISNTSRNTNKNISKIKNSSHKHLNEQNINNNILLNVQIINPSKKNDKDKINNYNANKIKKKEKPKYINTSKKELYKFSNNKKIITNFQKEKIIEKNIKSNQSGDNNYKNLNDQEMNSLNYEKAIMYDKRTYCQYYWSLLKKKQLILFTFLPANDYNLVSIKIALFITSFSLYFTINGFFFSDDTMHKIYIDKGAYNIVYRIPQILFSSVISSLIKLILKLFSLSEKNFIQLKRDKTITNIIEETKSVESHLRIKFLLFFILSSILMLFFWYFISTFCAVYTNTQLILFQDTILSFFASMIYPFGLNLLPGIFRIYALRDKNKKCLYTIGSIIALI